MFAPEFDHLQDGSVRGDLDAEHLAQHGDTDLKAYAGKKSDEYSLRKEVGEKAQLEQARDKQERGRQQRHHTGQLHIVGAAHRSERGEAPGKNRCGRGIGGDDQVSRGPEGGEGEQRQQECIEAGDDRHAGDFGVAQRLRDVHRRQLDAGKRVANGALPIERQHALEHTERAPLRSRSAHFFTPESSSGKSCPSLSSSARSCFLICLISSCAAWRSYSSFCFSARQILRRSKKDTPAAAFFVCSRSSRSASRSLLTTSHSA